MVLLVGVVVFGGITRIASELKNEFFHDPQYYLRDTAKGAAGAGKKPE